MATHSESIPEPEIPNSSQGFPPVPPAPAPMARGMMPVFAPPPNVSCTEDDSYYSATRPELPSGVDSGNDAFAPCCGTDVPTSNLCHDHVVTIKIGLEGSFVVIGMAVVGLLGYLIGRFFH